MSAPRIIQRATGALATTFVATSALISNVPDSDSDLETMETTSAHVQQPASTATCEAKFNGESLSLRDMAWKYRDDASLSDAQKRNLMNAAAKLTFEGCEETLTVLSPVSAKMIFVFENGATWHDTLKELKGIQTEKNYVSLDDVTQQIAQEVTVNDTKLTTPQVAPISGCEAEFDGELLSLRDIARKYYYDGVDLSAEQEKRFIDTAAALTAQGCEETLTVLSPVSATLVFTFKAGKVWHDALDKAKSADQIEEPIPYTSLDVSEQQTIQGVTVNGETLATPQYQEFLIR